MAPQWYSDFVVRRPYLLIVAVAVFCVACIVVSLTANTAPDFSDPTLGFETRGTSIGQRRVAWENLLRETEANGSLVENPQELEVQTLIYRHFLNGRHKHRRQRNGSRSFNDKRKHKGQKKRKKVRIDNSMLHSQESLSGDGTGNDTRWEPEWNGDAGIFRDFEITNGSANASDPSGRFDRNFTIQYGHNITSVDEAEYREKLQMKANTWNILREPVAQRADKVEAFPSSGYFCDAPSKSYSHFVVERAAKTTAADDSLFNLSGLLAMCQLQDLIVAVSDYAEYCEMEPETQNCCRPWSLPNYAALLANKTSCLELVDEDVVRLRSLLLGCFEYFHDLKLSNDCDKYRCYAPPECTRDNLVFNVLQLLTDYNFIKPNESHTFLKYAMIFVPVAQTTKILPLFYEWEKQELERGGVHVTGMDLGLESALFNELLITDWWLVALGGVFVMSCIWLYTSSAFVTFMTCIAVLFSLGLAYFSYTFVFKMTFFPYMNLLAFVVIIGIGSDDAFIFAKVWECVLAEKYTNGSASNKSDLAAVEAERTETLQGIMAVALHHAVVSMFVTSLTTAAAFYASYISSITAIKCFGIFAGTAVCANFLLMITWLPASVCIMERTSTYMVCKRIQLKTVPMMLSKSIGRFCSLFEAVVSAVVIKYAIMWIAVFTAIGSLSVGIVLYFPGIQLPETSSFQLFASNHPFELYGAKLKNEFWFEKPLLIYDKLPLRFVWGIQAVDDGDYTDPFALGNLHFDNAFNVSTKSSQLWLREFCHHLRQQPFYQPTFGSLLSNCFIENFITFMNRMCIDAMDGKDRTPCCDISTFPFEADVFDYCLPQSISSLYATPSPYFIPGVAGPKFFINRSRAYEIEEDGWLNESAAMYITDGSPVVKALVVEFESNISFTAKFHDLSKRVQYVEDWFAEELRTAPPEMSTGWFISELKFYDVQYTLTHGTQIAIAVSMVVALVVVLLVTLNVLVSLYAIITVTFTIFCVVAILILLGWKLNVLESVAVSTAIGLAVDFSLHYGIHFRLSPISERQPATRFALSRIIGPTAMAALTTSFGGALMMASSVLPYIQIGVFLLVVMTVSWTYATFFLTSLLHVAGPQHGFMQFNYPQLRRPAFLSGTTFVQRKQNRFVIRDQLLSPPSSVLADAVIYPETHELEALTTKSYIKTISGKEQPRAQRAKRRDLESDLHSLRSDSLRSLTLAK